MVRPSAVAMTRNLTPTSCQWGRAASAALLLALQLLLPGRGPDGVRLCEAFIYRPLTGLVWDPSCMTWGNRTFCYFM